MISQGQKELSKRNVLRHIIREPSGDYQLISEQKHCKQGKAGNRSKYWGGGSTFLTPETSSTSNNLLKRSTWVGEMAQCLKTLAALTEDPD